MRSTFQRLLFVRHGKAEHHVRRLTGGSTDLPLTGLGRLQAERAAHRLKELLGDAVTVGHGDSGGEVLNWWLGNEVDARLDFELAPASVSELVVGEWCEPRIIRTNDTAHLGGLRT